MWLKELKSYCICNLPPKWFVDWTIKSPSIRWTVYLKKTLDPPLGSGPCTPSASSPLTWISFISSSFNPTGSWQVTYNCPPRRLHVSLHISLQTAKAKKWNLTTNTRITKKIQHLMQQVWRVLSLQNTLYWYNPYSHFVSIIYPMLQSERGRHPKLRM